MAAHIVPTCQATVSPDLIQLLRRRLLSVDMANNAAVQERTEVSDARQQVQAQKLGTDWPFEKLVLRRDGRRPIVTDGMSVWWHEATVSGDKETVSLTHVVRLFVDRQARLWGQVMIDPEETLAVRPVVSACHLDSDEAISAFKKAASPERLFSTASCDKGVLEPLCERLRPLIPAIFTGARDASITS